MIDRMHHGGMELVDQLLVFLVGPHRSGATRQLIGAGRSEGEGRRAWIFARAAGYTEPTRLERGRVRQPG